MESFILSYILYIVSSVEGVTEHRTIEIKLIRQLLAHAQDVAASSDEGKSHCGQNGPPRRKTAKRGFACWVAGAPFWWLMKLKQGGTKNGSMTAYSMMCRGEPPNKTSEIVYVTLLITI